MQSVPIIKSGVNKTTLLSCKAHLINEMEWVKKLRSKLKPNKGFKVN